MTATAADTVSELVVDRDTVMRCTCCGRTERVEYARCMAAGWPLCHGIGMSLAETSVDVRAIWLDPPDRPRTVTGVYRAGESVLVRRRILGNGQLAFTAHAPGRPVLATFHTVNGSGEGESYGRVRDRVGEWATVDEWLDAIAEVTGETLEAAA